MNRCETCRHWVGCPGELGECMRITTLSEEDGAYVQRGQEDEGSWPSEFRTAATFGCVLHEPKRERSLLSKWRPA